MLCPKCNRHAISLLKFVLMFDTLTITCSSCGTTLKAGVVFRGIFYGAAIGSLLFCSLLMLGFNSFQHDFQWHDTIPGVGFVIPIIIASIIVGLLIEFFAWKNCRHKETYAAHDGDVSVQ